MQAVNKTEDRTEWSQMSHSRGASWDQASTGLCLFTYRGQGQAEQELKALQGKGRRVKILEDKFMKPKEQWQET